MMITCLIVMVELTLYKIFVPKKNPILAFFLYVITMIIILSSLTFCLSKGIIKESDLFEPAGTTQSSSSHNKSTYHRSSYHRTRRHY